MEAHCERKGLTIVARYREVGRGWSKKRPEFQRLLEDARQGQFETIVCWKSDRLSRGVYPAAALMEVVEAYGINLESVMDAIDMKTFGLMAAIAKIELDNFRERSSMGKRGAAKQGRVPSGGVPYGYRIGEDGRLAIVEEHGNVVRRIFRQYVHEDMGTMSIARQLTEEGVPPARSTRQWHQSHINRVLSNEAYKGVWHYGQTRSVSTEAGVRLYEKPRETWVPVAAPPLVDEETWDRAQQLKKERRSKSSRNTRTFYMLQHMMRCTECGLIFGAKSYWWVYSTRKGKKYRYDLKAPMKYYVCYGMQQQRLKCRERSFIRAEKVEGLVWREVSHVLKNPDLIFSGIESLDSGEGGSLKEKMERVERELKRVQQQEDRAIDLFVEGKITEKQFERQRGLITLRLEELRNRLDDFRARRTTAEDRRQATENVLAWAKDIGDGIDDMAPEERRKVLQEVVEGITIDSGNKLNIRLGIPVERTSAIDTPSPTSCGRPRWR